MYEHYLMTTKNGVTSIDFNVNEDNLATQPPTDDTENKQPYDPAGIELTVTFAVMTDAEAWVTLTGDGTVNPAFGGTGTSHREVMNYVQHAITIWRAVTGDEDTDFTVTTHVNA